MTSSTLWQSVKLIELSEANSISSLDSLLRSEQDFQGLSLKDIFSELDSGTAIAATFVALWAFDFLKGPNFSNGQLIGYSDQRFSDDEFEYIVRSLVSLIGNCHVEFEDDVDAIDWHYAACHRLCALTGTRAEMMIMQQLKVALSHPLIEALGVLVGHENQGCLHSSSIDFLKSVATQDGKFAERAQHVLLEDVNRVNRERPFLEQPVSLDSFGRS